MKRFPAKAAKKPRLRSIDRSTDRPIDRSLTAQHAARARRRPTDVSHAHGIIHLTTRVDTARRREDARDDYRRRQTAAAMSAKELSALTGHGVDDCKAVLAECGGDVERAVDAVLNSTY